MTEGTSTQTKSQVPAYYRSAEWRALRLATLQRDGFLCQYCGCKAIQADHVIPRGRGGPDILDNLVACCQTCNRTAGGKLFESFEAKKIFLSKRVRVDVIAKESSSKIPVWMKFRDRGRKKNEARRAAGLPVKVQTNAERKRKKRERDRRRKAKTV